MMVFFVSVFRVSIQQKLREMHGKRREKKVAISNRTNFGGIHALAGPGTEKPRAV